MPTLKKVRRLLLPQPEAAAAAVSNAAAAGAKPAADATTVIGAAGEISGSISNATKQASTKRPQVAPELQPELTKSERKRKKARRVTSSPLPPSGIAGTAYAAAYAASSSPSLSSASADKPIAAAKSARGAKRKTALDLLDSSSDEDDEYDNGKLTAAPAAKPSSRGAKRKTALDFTLEPSSDEDDYDDDEMQMAIAASLQEHDDTTLRRSGSNRRGSGASSRPGTNNEWLTSFHATKNKRARDESSDDSSSSSESDSDDDDGLDPRLAAISRRNWTSSSEKLDHMQKVTNDADKALQMLLWDLGFDYKIYLHQFEAIRFVAGLVPTFPYASNGLCADNEDMDDMLKLDGQGQYARSGAVRSAGGADAAGSSQNQLLPTRGILLADEMGLGKTIESLAGAALRNAMQDGIKGTRSAATKKSSPRRLPTLIVSPQDGIQTQWYETLRKAGVEPARIKVVGEKKSETKKRNGHANTKSARGGYYILCTRYRIQSEMRRLFDCTTMTDLEASHKSFMLFPHVPLALIKKLRNQYCSEKGTEQNQFRRKREPKQDCVARLVRESFRGNGSSLKAAFQTVIIDECHFVKNVLAYWGLGSALLGTQSKRTIILTGTPYNNGPQDMSALMTFIDPTHEAARIGWWEKATSKRSKQGVAEAVSEWRKAFMLRRTKDVLQTKLPPRIREMINVGAYPSELSVYEAYEAKFLNALDQLNENMEDDSPASRRRVKEIFEIMMSCMACMRMSLIHPMLPGGREITIQFSPSRRHLMKREERPKRCVLCSGTYPTQAAEKFAARKAGIKVKEEEEEDRPLLGLDARVRSEMDLDDDELDDEDNAGFEIDNSAEKQKGPLVELNADICQASGSDCRHFAHERCLEVHIEKGCEGCPRCHDLSSRIHIADPANAGKKLPQKVYCEEITTSVNSAKGFTASAKIEEAIQWFQTTVPMDEKAIILSFFKGSLDLIEGILSDEFSVECARYDGDVDKDIRTRDLQRFRTSDTCRVLLASVQSGGTGLNITEANNVCFLDRWFNPCVHDQAESRCHRLGQEKPVKIAYLDNNLTVDNVMKRVNVLKEGNAGVLLADGTSLGDQRWSLGYQNLSGVIGNTLKAIQDMRQCISATDVPLPPYNESDLDTKLQEMLSRTSRKKRSVKTEEDDDIKEESRSIEHKFEPRRSSTLQRPSSSHSSSSSDDDSILEGGPTFGGSSRKTGAGGNVKSEREETEAISSGMSAPSSQGLREKETYTSSTSTDIPSGTSSTSSPGTGEKETETFAATSATSSRDEPAKEETSERPTSSGSMSSNDSILKEVAFTSGREKAANAVKEEYSGTTSIARSNGSNDIIELSSDEEEDDYGDADIQAALRKSLEETGGSGVGMSIDSGSEKKQEESESMYEGSAEYQQALLASICETTGPEEVNIGKKKSASGLDNTAARSGEDDIFYDAKMSAEDKDTSVASDDEDEEDEGPNITMATNSSEAAEASNADGANANTHAGAGMSPSELMQAMNNAMMSGDKKKAEELFKKWQDTQK